MNYIIPLLLTAVIISALIKKTPVYSSFTDGAQDGVKTVVTIFPAMAAVMVAAYMMRASGALESICEIISPLTDAVGIPAEIIPLALIRPLSGSGALGILTDILNTYGPDTEIGKLASVIMGSTETTFYCICVYFSKTKVKYSAKVIPCAIIGDAVGMILGIITGRL